MTCNFYQINIIYGERFMAAQEILLYLSADWKKPKSAAQRAAHVDGWQNDPVYGKLLIRREKVKMLPLDESYRSIPVTAGNPTTPGMLTSSRKRRRRIRGGREAVFPDEPQKGLAILARSLKASPLHLSPQIPPPPLKRPPTESKMLCYNSLDAQFPFLYIHLTSKRVLINSRPEISRSKFVA